MPKAQVRSQDWRDDQATEAQISRLLMLLKVSEVIDPKPNEDLEDWEPEAVDWVNQYTAGEIRRLSDLTKGEMQMLYGHLE